MLKKKLISLFTILLVVVVVSSQEKEPEISISYTYNTKHEIHGDGIHILTINKEKYADSNGTLLKDARSLKDCEFCDRIKIDIDQDTNYPLSIIDYNYTNISICVKIGKSTLANQDVPLTVSGKNRKQYIRDVRISNLLSQECMTLPFGMDQQLKWGYNSTTLQYHDFLDDTQLDEIAPTTNYGSSLTFFIRGSNTGARSYYVSKVDISNITGEMGTITILSANFSMYKWGGSAVGDTLTYSIYNTTNETWGESTATWNFQPSHDSADGSAVPSVVDNVNALWHNWSAKNIIQQYVNNGQENATVLIKDDNDIPTGYFSWWYSDEEIESVDPYWIIIFDVANACTYSGSGNWHINCTDGCVIGAETVVSGNITIFADPDEGNVSIIDDVTLDNLYKHGTECKILVDGGSMNFL